MEEGAGRGAPGGELERSPGEGEEAQGFDAAGAVAARGVVSRRGVGRGRSRAKVLIVINTGAPGARGVQEGRADQSQGGLQERRTRGVRKRRRW